MNFIKLNFLLLSVFLLTAQSVPANAQKPSGKRPNILICIADDASMEHMSAYNKQQWVKTPSFDRVATEGLLFLNAYTPNAKCAPSRACILTGRNPWQLEEAGNHNPYFPAKFITVMEGLGANGYTTGFTGKGWGPGEPGKGVDGRRRELIGTEYNSQKLTPPTPEISDIDYATNFEVFLQSRKAGQPFAFWYGGKEPHREYTYGSGTAKGKKNTMDIPAIPPFWIDNDTTRNDMLDYAFEVEYFDKQLGRILSILEAAGELENTLIVVTSDNGMPFPRIKGHLYEYDNHLPLAIMWKGQIKNPGRKIEDYISFTDFTPTFLEAANLSPEKTGMQPVQGASLMPILRSSSGTFIDKKRDFVLLGREREDVGRPHDVGYPVRGIIKNGYFFAKNYEPTRWPSGNPETGYMDTDGSPTKSEILKANRKGNSRQQWEWCFGLKPMYELYDFKKDPWLVTNLAANKIYRSTMKDLELSMEAMLTKQNDPRMFDRGDVFDKYPYAQTGVKDFYERYMKGEKITTGWLQPTDFERKPLPEKKQYQ